MKFRIILILSICIFAARVSAGGYIVITSTVESTKTIEFFTERVPPPEGYRYITDLKTPKRIDAKIIITSKSDFSGKKNRYLTSFYRVPVFRLRDNISDISIEEARELASHPESDSKLVFLEDGMPPGWKAVSVGGKYPFQKDYPLTVRLYASIETKDRSVAKWFERIPLPFGRQDRIVWLSFVGDIMLARGVDSLLLDESGGLKMVFGGTIGILRNTDITMGNLECVASLKGEKIKKSYTFHFNPKALIQLKEAGFDYLSLTNNHVFDYGIAAFEDSLNNMKKAGIGFSGAGKNIIEASKPWTTNVGGNRIAVFSVGAYPAERTGFSGKDYRAGKGKPGIIWADSYFMKLLSKETSKRQLDIVMVHGGVEWTSKPTASEKRLYRRFVDLGADLVIGTHPHFIQGMEHHGKGIIAYSLGNFIFPGMEDTGYGDKSIILRIGIYRNMVIYVETLPVVLKGRGVRLSPLSDGKNRILDRFYQLTSQLESGKAY